MCTNYENDASPKSIADRFGLKDVPETIPVSSLRPTDPALVIGSGDNARILRWGFEAAWSKQPLVNARAETLSVKPTFHGVTKEAFTRAGYNVRIVTLSLLLTRSR